MDSARDALLAVLLGLVAVGGAVVSAAGLAGLAGRGPLGHLQGRLALTVACAGLSAVFVGVGAATAQLLPFGVAAAFLLAAFAIAAWSLARL